MKMDRRNFVATMATMAGGVAGSMVLGISNAQAGADLATNTDEEKKAMADIILRSGNLLLQLDKKGGAITGFWQQRQGESEPVALLRPLTDGTPSCFPLVPFGNRVKDNHFIFNGQNHTLEPNTDWDRHYLHGEGWQADWSVVEERSNHLVMEFEHRGGEAAYNYQARQTFTLSDDMLEVRLAVKNIGHQHKNSGLRQKIFYQIDWQISHLMSILVNPKPCLSAGSTMVCRIGLEKPSSTGQSKILPCIWRLTHCFVMPLFLSRVRGLPHMAVKI